MKPQKTDLLYTFSKVLTFATFIPLIFGILIEYDGLSIMLQSNLYKDGILRGDSIETSPTSKSQQSAVYVLGYADSVYTSILVGNTETFYTDSVLDVFTNTKSVLLPVWYKPDGELTIERYKNEKEFPFWRVTKKTMLYFIAFCSPFILTLIWRVRLGKKLKKEKAHGAGL